MKSYQLGPKVTLVAGEAITKRRFVDATGKHTLDKAAVGVALFDTDQGDPITVQVAGIAVVESGGAINAGDLVASDANGKAVALTLSAVGDVAKICGIALDAATGAGEFIRVKLGL